MTARKRLENQSFLAYIIIVQVGIFLFYLVNIGTVNYLYKHFCQVSLWRYWKLQMGITCYFGYSPSMSPILCCTHVSIPLHFEPDLFCRNSSYCSFYLFWQEREKVLNIISLIVMDRIDDAYRNQIAALSRVLNVSLCLREDRVPCEIEQVIIIDLNFQHCNWLVVA